MSLFIDRHKIIDQKFLDIAIRPEFDCIYAILIVFLRVKDLADGVFTFGHGGDDCEECLTRWSSLLDIAGGDFFGEDIRMSDYFGNSLPFVCGYGGEGAQTLGVGKEVRINELIAFGVFIDDVIVV